MTRFLGFSFSGDTFYQEETVVHFQPGITLLRGRNHDAGPTEEDSNGAGKSRLLQILCGFIYNTSERGNFKKMVRPSFKGTLDFEIAADRWSFFYDVKANEWKITKNGEPLLLSHKASESQKLLAELIGLNRKEWGNYVHINRRSITTLLHGDAAARRQYLENFFDIDEWYKLKKEEYHALKKAQEEQLHSIKQDQAALGQVLEALKGLPEKVALEEALQKNSDDLNLHRTLRSETTECINQYTKDLQVWEQYYRSCKQLEDRFGPDSVNLPPLEEELRIANKKLGELRSLQKQKTVVQQKISRNPNLITEAEVPPEIPVLPRVKAEDVVNLERLVSSMREKSRLITQFKNLQKDLPDIQDTVEELQEAKATLLQQRATLAHKISLVSDGRSCSRCGTKFDFLTADVTPETAAASLRTEMRELDVTVKDIETEIAKHTKHKTVSVHLMALKEQIEAFGVFGRKLAEAEQDLEDKKTTLGVWQKFDRDFAAYEKRNKERELFLAELKTLGYPKILDTDVSGDVAELEHRIPILEQDIFLIRSNSQLMEEATKLAKKSVLDGLLVNSVASLKTVDDNLTKLSEIKGSLTAQLQQVLAHLKTKESLEKKVAVFEDAYKEYQIIESLHDFFSPTGFKLFELRRRCEYLIERANFWSPSFFREQHEWLMPTDLDDLDFLVQPVKHRKTPPFSASMLSAGEENRAERILLFSQLDLMPKDRKVNLLVLDEIEGHLDPAGRRVFTEIVVPKLKETYSDRSVILISHEESLLNSPAIDHLWVAERRDRKTTLATTLDVSRKVNL